MMDNPQSIRLGVLYLRGRGQENEDPAVLARLMSVSLCERLRLTADVKAHVLELAGTPAEPQDQLIPGLQMSLAHLDHLLEANRDAHPGLKLDFVAYGEVEVTDGVSLTVRLLRLQDETVVYESTFTGARTALFELLGAAGEGLLGALGLELSPEVQRRLRSPETRSFEAYLYCARGLDHLTPGAARAGLNPAEGVKHLVDAVRRDPQFDRAYRLAWLYAIDCLKKKDHATGTSLLRELLRHRPQDEEGHALLGHFLLSQGRLKEARQCFDQSLEIRLNAPAWVGLALLYERVGETSLALDCYRRAQAINPLPGDTRQRWAALAAQAGCLEEAIGIWRHLLRENPDDVRLYSHLGRAYQWQGDLDQAQWCYEQALELDSEFWGAVYGLAQLHWQNQEYERGLELYRRAAILQPKQALVQYDLGMALLHEGHFEKARPVLQKALELGLPEEQAKQAREHLVYLEEPWFRAEVRADLACRHCAALIAEGHYAEALPDLQRIVKDLPEHDPSWYCLGLAYQGLNRPDKAARALREALMLEPHLADAHNQLSVALLQMGDSLAAHRHAAQAYRERPSDPEIIRNFGLACLSVGHREEGRWLLSLARGLAPQDPITQACWEVLRQTEEP